MPRYRRMHSTKRDETELALTNSTDGLSRRDRDIATAYAAGQSVHRIATRYGLTHARIYQILTMVRNRL